MRNQFDKVPPVGLKSIPHIRFAPYAESWPSLGTAASLRLRTASLHKEGRLHGKVCGRGNQPLAGSHNLVFLDALVGSALRRTSYKGFPASAEAGEGRCPFQPCKLLKKLE